MHGELNSLHTALPDSFRRVVATILGVPVELHVPARLADELLRALSARVSSTRGSSGADVTYALHDGGSEFEVVRADASGCVLIDSADSIDRSAELIADDVHRWVAEHHPDLLLIHAGAVAWHGLGIVVPGRSRSGKTSLVAALLRAGAQYLSDEFAPLDRRGMVHPYPRHLSIRSGDGPPSLVPATVFSATTARAPVPLRYVVDTSYVPGGAFTPERLRGVGPLLTLADNTLVARSRPAHTMSMIAEVAPRVTVLRSVRDDANEAALAILGIVDADLERSR